MSDEGLRELEQRASEGPEAYRAWLEALVRLRDERVVEAEAFGAELEAWVAAFREQIVLETQGWHGKVPVMNADSLLPALREALRPLGEGFAGTGFGFRQLGRIYQEPRQERSQDENFYDAPTPLVPVVFVARLEGRFVCGFASSQSRKVTPGTSFPALSPWRQEVSPQARERRLLRWRDESEGLTTAPEDVVGIWVDLRDLERAEAGAAREGEPMSARDLDYATEKQVKFVEALWDQKGLDEAAFTDILRTQSGLRSPAKLQYLGRHEASSMIEVLLALPDAKRRRRAKPESGDALPPAPFDDPAPFADAASREDGLQAKSPPKEKAKKKKAKKAGAGKVLWEGTLLAVQPRITMGIIGRDEQHGYKGYTLYLRGELDGVSREFSVGIGKAAQAKHGFQAGLLISGAGAPAPPGEGIDLYKASKLKIDEATPAPAQEGPPWTGLPLELPAYRAAGHRTLTATALDGPPCGVCIHGCLMPVDEHGERTLSAECYGPRDCSAFQAGSR